MQDAHTGDRADAAPCHPSQLFDCLQLTAVRVMCPSVPESTVKLVSNRGANIPKRFGTFPKCHF